MKAILLLLPVVLLASCVRPKYGYLPTPAAFKYHTKGLYAKVETGEVSIVGELIAVEEERVILLGQAESGQMVTLKREEVDEIMVQVALTSNDYKKLQGFGVLFVLPLAHGLWGIFSWPLSSIIAGSLINDATNGRYVVGYPGKIDWDDLKKFARFPQGIPPGVSLDDIR